MARAEKENAYPSLKRTVKTDWAWAHPTYTFETSKTIKNITIDPSGLMADIDRTNNTYKNNNLVNSDSPKSLKFGVLTNKEGISHIGE